MCGLHLRSGQWLLHQTTEMASYRSIEMMCLEYLYQTDHSFGDKRFNSQAIPSAAPQHTYLFPFSLFAGEETDEANCDVRFKNAQRSPPAEREAFPVKSRVSAVSPNITAGVMAVVEECSAVRQDDRRCEFDFLQQSSKLV